MNQDTIKNAIAEKVKDPTVVADIISIMDTLRPKSVRVNLKTTGKRMKISKDEDVE